MAGAALFAEPGGAEAADPPAPASLGDVLILDSRLRYEFVDQKGLPEEARALTLRTRIGFETPAVRGVSALLEVEALKALVDDYNDGLNGRTRFPAVGDPEGVELNRAQVSWTGAEGSEVVVGRQRLSLDNGRFIGNSGWRQREQTFDALWATTEGLGPLTLSYGYLDDVLRTVGRENPQGVWDSDSHLLRAEAETPLGKWVAYGYLLDLPSAPLQSNASYGGRLTGKAPVSDGLEATYVAEYAHQTDHGSNTREFDLDYLLVEGGLKASAWSLAAQVERLDGDGRVGFMTPLASNYGLHGWSDAIVIAPPAGLLDLNLKAAVEWKSAPVGKGLKFSASAYDFSDADRDQAFGREFNAGVATRLTDSLSAEIKAATFDGDTTLFADRTKVWAMIEYKY